MARSGTMAWVLPAAIAGGLLAIQPGPGAAQATDLNNDGFISDTERAAGRNKTPVRPRAPLRPLPEPEGIVEETSPESTQAPIREQRKQYYDRLRKERGQQKADD